MNFAMHTKCSMVCLFVDEVFNLIQIREPFVCGITSLGYDHMEILGNTLGEIAGEKAGIFKNQIPAFTVPQLDKAMLVLEEKASQLNAIVFFHEAILFSAS
ncbi:hypothetical protein AHAS_Ahas16G0211500 [Arachis hypogaea]